MQNAKILTYYNPEIFIAPVIIGIIFFTTSIFLFYKNKKIDKLIIIFISFWIIGVGIKLLLTLPIPFLQNLNNNASAWRLLWIFIGSGQLPHDLPLLFIVLSLNFFKLIHYKKVRIKIFNFLLLFSLIPIFIPAIQYYIGWSTLNIQLNLQKISKDDIKFIESMENNNFELSYLNFAPISGYIKGKVDMNSIFNSDIWLSLYRPHFFLSFYNPDKFEEEFRNLKIFIRDNIFTSISGQRISEIDYIFFDNQIDNSYQNIIKNNFNYALIYPGSQISIFKLIK